ncbi:YdeI/OmpD-associated family protein [Lacticaseibacillus parakribbianus]|uniref:YdeI/OmpD-associated family protein n=1 Tax=Lacticaseibacillus parakribbianus TaxID=2970927 RepID=UPI0021CB2193|nr:YdeI/OmpD-associated family protein [Lacticaseibacillus parakribbianus]
MPNKPLAAYEADIPKVAAMLADQPEAQAFFNALTPGYQREWARYLFGVASPATASAHQAKMLEVFAAGYKSKRAYDSRPK